MEGEREGFRIWSWFRKQDWEGAKKEIWGGANHGIGEPGYEARCQKEDAWIAGEGLPGCTEGLKISIKGQMDSGPVVNV